MANFNATIGSPYCHAIIKAIISKMASLGSQNSLIVSGFWVPAGRVADETSRIVAAVQRRLLYHLSRTVPF